MFMLWTSVSSSDVMYRSTPSTASSLAKPALRKALAGDASLEVRQRVKRLLDNLSGQVPQAGQLRETRQSMAANCKL